MVLANFVLYLFLVCLSLAFVGCQESSETAVPKLIKNLNSQDKHLRNTAALKLGSYGSEAESAVPSLIKLLKDENGGVRIFCGLCFKIYW